MALHYADEQVTVYHGDCIETMRELPENSVDAIITDPPYGIRFMGEAWDIADIEGLGGSNGGHRSVAAEDRNYDPSLSASQAFQKWCTSWARECLRVLKPGGYMLAFGSPRMGGRLMCGIEDAGFEIRDTIMWVYGSGFPKSLNIAKAVDAHLLTGGSSSRRLRQVEMHGSGDLYEMTGKNNGIMGETVTVSRRTWVPETQAAEEYQGWGTGLKPAFEPCVVARKPLAGTVAKNVLAYGTGGMNIDACRVEMTSGEAAAINAKHAGMDPESYQLTAGHSLHLSTRPMPLQAAHAHKEGRWPTNMCLNPHAALLLEEQEAGASRYFPTFRYEAKASANERPEVDGVQHPTVKPLELMRWLVRLVAPHGATVLEPFAGSGTTLEACLREGVKCIGIEREEKYLPLIMQRLSKDIDQPLDFGEWSA